MLRVERLTATPLTPSVIALPAEWTGRYSAPLSDVAPFRLAVLDVGDPTVAAGAVRAGHASLAFTTAPDAADLPAVALETVAVAFIVPLTFPVEGISISQARDIVAGRLQSWSEVGGPARPMAVGVSASLDEAGIIRRILGTPGGAQALAPLSAREGAIVPGSVEVRLWAGAGPRHKALAVDSLLPDEPGYPLVERRVLVARPEQHRALDEVGAVLRHALASRRPAEVTLDAVGDIMLGRDVGKQIAAHGTGFPFERVRPVLAASDIRFGNLELPLTERGNPARKDYVFRAPPSSVAALTGAGFTVVSLANNHMLDYGVEGLLDTLATLDRAGIARAGAGRTLEEARAPALLTIKGLRIAFLAYVNVPNDSVSGFVMESTAATRERPGVAWGRTEDVRRDVTAVRARADVVVVSLHSGFEYTAEPNAIQRELAQAAVDAGAALVLGGHPHVLQGVEFYRGVPIIYSLGNFVFDLDDDDRRQPGLPSVLTVIFRVTLTTQGVTSVRFIPAVIDEREARPIPVTGAAARPVYERLYRLTDALNGQGN